LIGEEMSPKICANEKVLKKSSSKGNKKLFFPCKQCAIERKSDVIDEELSPNICAIVVGNYITTYLCNLSIYPIYA